MKTARLALSEIRVCADSPQETRMRLILARSGHGEPVLNYVIRNTWGQPAVWPIRSNGSLCCTTAATTPIRSKSASIFAASP